jgi:hypothetical protein
MEGIKNERTTNVSTNRPMAIVEPFDEIAASLS